MSRKHALFLITIVLTLARAICAFAFLHLVPSSLTTPSGLARCGPHPSTTRDGCRIHHLKSTLAESETITLEREEDVLRVLSEVIDPDLGQDIVSLGFVKELRFLDGDTAGEKRGGAVVSFNVELTTPACPVKESFQSQCRELVEALPWVEIAEVTMTSQPMRPASETTPTGLSMVSNILAVSSCKGGVGKSTTAVNLAYALKSKGAKVGLLDADIYGPSIPTMVKPDNDAVEFVGNEIRPLQAHGVKLMSYGFVNRGTAIMRGPMVSQLLQQFVSLTSWGELDYLVIDMPPGTGDIQLTLCQILNITAAVIVTTPQKLSFSDVVKGIDLFDTVNVPSIAVVENMAYYDSVDSSGLVDGLERSIDDILRLEVDDIPALARQERLDEVPRDETALRAALVAKLVSSKAAATERRYIFGKGHRQRLADMWGIKNTVQMPLEEQLARSGDSGVPFVVENPTSERSARYMGLADEVVRELAKLKYGSNERPELSFQRAAGTITVTMSKGQQVMGAAELRRQCRCALCVEEFSGRQLLDPSTVPEDIAPASFSPIGNYAVAVQWSDGHSSLYPYSSFVKGYESKTKRQEVSKL